MYPKKVEYFSSGLFETGQDFLSGVTTTDIEDLLVVGTPCLFTITDKEVRKERPRKKDPFEYPDWLANPYSTGSVEYRSGSKDSDDSIKISDIYRIAETGGLAKANEFLSEFVYKGRVLVLFPPWNGSNYGVYTINSSRFYFNGRKPLIYDDCKHNELRRLSDIHDKEEISGFPEMMVEELSKYRYVNYLFSGVARSNVKSVLTELDEVFMTIYKKFPINVCFSQFDQSRLRYLVDVVSVSFYDISDMIPVFDYRKKGGMGMEVFLTNSRLSGKTLMDESLSATYRFIFSNSRDNIFSVDGEPVGRPHDLSTVNSLQNMRQLIEREVPNDGGAKTLMKSAQEEV